MINGIKIIHVVAADGNNVIGCDNTIPWHYTEDFKHFKQTTMGGVLLMGRKTYESIGRPLPGRITHVLTREAKFLNLGVVISNTIEEALKYAISDVRLSKQPDRLFIVGGGELYKLTMDIVDEIYITRVPVNVLPNDNNVKYPDIPDEFKLASSYVGKSGCEFDHLKRKA